MDTVGVLWGFRNREELEGCHPQYICGTSVGSSGDCEEKE